jgi:hypothetical protein
MTEHDPSPDRPTRNDADAADAREVDVTIDSFSADLHELQDRCRTLAQAIEAGDPDRIEPAASQVALGLQIARTTLEPANRRRPCAPNAYISLCAAYTIVGHLFRRALLSLKGGSAGEVRTRITLHRLAAELELETDPPGQ